MRPAIKKSLPVLVLLPLLAIVLGGARPAHAAGVDAIFVNHSKEPVRLRVYLYCMEGFSGPSGSEVLVPAESHLTLDWYTERSFWCQIGSKQVRVELPELGINIDWTLFPNRYSVTEFTRPEVRGSNSRFSVGEDSWGKGTFQIDP